MLKYIKKEICNEPHQKRSLGKVKLTTSFHQQDYNSIFSKELLKQKNELHVTEPQGNNFSHLSPVI